MTKVVTEINNPIMLAGSFWIHLFAILIIYLYNWKIAIPAILLACITTFKGIFPTKEVSLE